LVLGDNDTGFFTDTNDVVAFNVNTGKPLWAWTTTTPPVNIVTSTAGGGLIATTSDQSGDHNATVIRFDSAGNPTTDTWTPGSTLGFNYFIVGSSWSGFSSTGNLIAAYAAAPVELSSAAWYALGGNGGKAAVQNLSLTNFSKTGANQATIASVLQNINTGLPSYALCNNWLQGAGESSGISGSQDIQSLLSNNWFGHATINQGTNVNYTIAAFSGTQNPDGTLIPNLPSSGVAMTVNDLGAFFNLADNQQHTFLVGIPQYPGNSPQAQSTILVHEVAHQITVYGFQPDFGRPKAGKANNVLVNTNCSGLIGGPTIQSLSPSSGPVGTSVTIAGKNFGMPQGSGTVMFNSGVVAMPTSWTDSAIVVAVPTGATTGNVVVTASGGQSSSKTFTVQ